MDYGYKTMTLADGCFYAGNVLNDKPHGKGIGIWPDGSKFVGNWLNGIPQGSGQFVDTKGNTLYGFWIQGKLIHQFSNPETMFTSEQEFPHGQPQNQSNHQNQNERSDNNPGIGLALVIGNQAYRSAVLRNPVNDAKAFTSKLSSLGYDVMTLCNGNLNDIGNALSAVERVAHKYDTFIFYFSGHGCEYQGTNYMMPIESGGQPTLDQMVSLDSLIKRIDSTNMRLKVYILDCCRNIPFKAIGFGSFSPKSCPNNTAAGTVIAFATSKGNYASDGASTNSPYMEAILNVIETPNIPILEFFRLVTKRVKETTHDNQIPWISASIDGEYCFYKK